MPKRTTILLALCGCLLPALFGGAAPSANAAGLRWDTSFSTDGDRSGPGWSEMTRPTGGFRLRHPLGVGQALPGA